MELMDKLKGLITGKKRLDRIAVDELRRERIRLEQIEQRVNKDVEELEKRKQQLFAKGMDEPSQRQQIAIARKIKELDVGAQAKDRQLAMISRQMRILTGFMTLKENDQLVKDLGVSSIVSQMDLDDLQQYVERATVEGQFQMERFAQILKTMESPDGMELGAVEGADTVAIVAAMQEAKAAEAEDPCAAMRQGIRKLDQVLREDGEASPNAEHIS